jgi:hypothetical protein
MLKKGNRRARYGRGGNELRNGRRHKREGRWELQRHGVMHDHDAFYDMLTRHQANARCICNYTDMSAERRE